MKSTFGCIVFFLFSFYSEITKAQELKLDSLVSDLDRICDCRNLKSSSEESYASCLEKELENPFFHRTDFLQLSNYWVGKNELKSYQYAKDYFNLGGYFIGGVDSSLLKKHVHASKLKGHYFNEFFRLALLNENHLDSVLQSNLKLSKAISQLKPYDQFMRSNMEENLELMNDTSLENSAWKFQIRLDSLNRLTLTSILDSTWNTVDHYGSEANKQVYIYGGLDFTPTILNRAYGMTWGIGGWLLMRFLGKLPVEKVLALHKKVADEINTTFASSFSKELSLEEAIQPKTILKYNAKKTGEKYLINPSK
jgi:hypothetical protein